MRTAPKAVGLAAAAVTALSLIGAGTGSAAPATHLSHAKPAAAHHAKTPTLKVTVKNVSTTDKRHYSYTINKTTLHKGLVKVSVHGVKTPAEVGLETFTGGYTYKDYVASRKLSTGNNHKAALKALRQYIKHTVSYGGPTAENPGDTQTDVLDLNRTGRVYVTNETGDLPKKIAVLHVVGPKADRQAVKPGGTIKAHTDSNDQSRFGGDSTLTHRGYIAFKVTKGSASPHFLVLIHVKDGTTKKQVKQVLECQKDCPPPPILPGEVDTSVVSAGHTQDVHVHLPKGEYVELCFFPDDRTGMPHALMGMIKIVHLV